MQMAHYFKRFFGGSSEVDVLNYLRVELDGEVAQMDHLVLHSYGITIVESKSVAGSVEIREDGQWIRWYSKQSHGMRSPVTQAEMQLMLLKELLARTVKQKGFFDSVDFDVLVAISDSGTIQWPSSGSLPEVCKSDQVPDRILRKLKAKLEKKGSPVLLPVHRRSIADFLRSIHRPLNAISQPDPAVLMEPRVATTERVEQVSVVSVPVDPLPTAGVAERLPRKACKHCGGSTLEVRHSKFGYYFGCKSCEKNTPIKFTCPSCGGEGRLRKHAKEFFAECASCDASFLYHVNN